jgi:aspartate kinase
MGLHVYKFGGTSTGSPDAILSICRIVAEASRAHRVVVVVSAFDGVTNALHAGAREAAAGRTEPLDAAIRELGARFRAAAECLVGTGEERERLEVECGSLLGELAALGRGVFALGELTPRALDAIVSVGERLSAPLVSAALRDRGVASVAVDARSVVATDARHGGAVPLLGRTRKRADRLVRPILEARIVPVVTGYIGASPESATTTLGRGGSDYSAAILAAVLRADDAIFFKEVDGIMSADPATVPEARTISRLTYGELGALAGCGAGVLQLAAVELLARRRVRTSIRNTFRPDAPGTVVADGEVGGPSVKAVTAVEGLSLIRVRRHAAKARERVRSALSGVGDHVLSFSHEWGEFGESVVLVPSARGDAARGALETVLSDDIARRRVSSVTVESEVTVVGMVGSGVASRGSLLVRALAALDAHGISVHAVAACASGCGVRVVVGPCDGATAVRAVHSISERAELAAAAR